jgi:hypothetical protein
MRVGCGVGKAADVALPPAGVSATRVAVATAVIPNADWKRVFLFMRTSSQADALTLLRGRGK